MVSRGITRRSLLAATAGAITGGLTRPSGVFGALAGPARVELEERWVGRLASAGLTLQLRRNADLVGVEWGAPANTPVELRFRRYGGAWSTWVSAGAHGHGPDRLSSPDRVIGDPVWTGGTTLVQLRAGRTLNGVRLHLVDASGGAGAHGQAIAAGPLASGASLPLAMPVLQAGPGQPPIFARRSWARGMARPAVAPAYGAVRMAFVHHTENPNGYAPAEVPAMLRAIFVFHRYVNGWNDIGYNFVVDLYGRVFEARAGGIDEPVIGAHAGGYNRASTGVAVLGSFMSQTISVPARRALDQLLAWKLALHGVSADGRVEVRVDPAGAVYSRFPANALVSLAHISGHRDADSTDCPGDALYGELPGIRASVGRLAPRPARATLILTTRVPPAEQTAPGAGEPSTPGVDEQTASGVAPPPAPAGPGQTPPAGQTPPGQTTPAGQTTTGAALAGGLALLDGTPISGAPIVVQARSVKRRGEVVNERTIAETVTDGEGRWSLPVGIASAGMGGTWLRAVWSGAGGEGSAGAGAAVSDPLFLAGTALFSLPEAPPPTPPAAPPPAT
jgi:hypothetical protein